MDEIEELKRKVRITISISYATREKLIKILSEEKKNRSYDELINDLIDFYLEKKELREGNRTIPLAVS